MRNMISQTFDYDRIIAQMSYDPTFLLDKYSFLGIKLTKGVTRAIKEFRPDIILVSECGIIATEVVLYKYITSAKYKVTSIIDDSYDMICGNQFSRKHEIAEKILIPLFNNVICVENRANEVFQEKYGKGIFFPIIRNEQTMRVLYSRVLHISKSYQGCFYLKGKKVFLFVGRLVPLKNVQRIIKSFITANIEDSVLIIVGNGPEEEKCKNEANGHGNIIFTGRLEGDALYAWYNVADVLILASWQEAFGAVTNEALLAGCVCLVSHHAGSQCLIKEGVNGFKINPFCTEDISQKMRKAVDIIPYKDLETTRSNMMQESFETAIQRVITGIK